MSAQSGTGLVDPPHDCAACPRLVDLRHELQATQPEWFNAPVPSLCSSDPPKLLILGLAPGMRGANATGRPFTGDSSGDLLFKTMKRYDFAEGQGQMGYGMALKEAIITNAVRCLPPQNKPTSLEIKNCRRYLTATLSANPSIKVVLALGRVAHETFLSALDVKRAQFPFAHGGRHNVPGAEYQLFDSYHCSRYNTNTGRLTEKMFNAVFQEIRAHLAANGPGL